MTDVQGLEDIQQKIAKGNQAFNPKKKLLCSENVSLKSRKNFLKTYV